MNLVLIATIVILLLIICIVLLIILLKRNDTSKVIEEFVEKEDELKNVQEEKNKVTIIEKTSPISKLKFPRRIELLADHLLLQACINIFETFKALEYAKKNDFVLNNYEWHSWQISLLLSFIQREEHIFIPHTKNLFHKVIVDKPLITIKRDFEGLIDKYQNSVNIHKSRDELSKDLIWSAKEVSVIFYYMLNMKNIDTLD